MAVTFDIVSKSAFVLRSDAVNRVWAILESTIGSVSATASCADNARREFGSLSQLMAFDNAKAKEIRSLQFSASSKDFKRRGGVTFGGWPNQISVTLSAQEDNEILQAREELRDATGGTRAWYLLISRIKVDVGLFAFVGVLWLVSLFVIFLPPLILTGM